jgi:hypothetical protein
LGGGGGGCFFFLLSISHPLYIFFFLNISSHLISSHPLCSLLFSIFIHCAIFHPTCKPSLRSTHLYKNLLDNFRTTRALLEPSAMGRRTQWKKKKSSYCTIHPSMVGHWWVLIHSCHGIAHERQIERDSSLVWKEVGYHLGFFSTNLPWETKRERIEVQTRKPRPNAQNTQWEALRGVI